MAKDTKKRQRELTCQRKEFGGPVWQAPPTPKRVANSFTPLCCIRALTGQEEVGLLLVLFGDMYMLEKYLPLCHIPDPKEVHFLDIAGNQEVASAITRTGQRSKILERK